MDVFLGKPLPCNGRFLPVKGRGLEPVYPEKVEGATWALKSEICEFPSVFACSRVLKLAIGAHEII